MKVNDAVLIGDRVFRVLAVTPSGLGIVSLSDVSISDGSRVKIESIDEPWLVIGTFCKSWLSGGTFYFCSTKHTETIK
jgi:hypothetical protein